MNDSTDLTILVDPVQAEKQIRDGIGAFEILHARRPGTIRMSRIVWESVLAPRFVYRWGDTFPPGWDANGKLAFLDIRVRLDFDLGSRFVVIERPKHRAGLRWDEL